MKKNKQTPEGITALTTVCITRKCKIMRTKEQMEQQSILQNTRFQICIQEINSRQSFQIPGLAEVYFSAIDLF